MHVVPHEDFNQSVLDIVVGRHTPIGPERPRRVIAPVHDAKMALCDLQTLTKMAAPAHDNFDDESDTVLTMSHDTMAMSMSTDEIDEAYSPGGRSHTDDHGDADEIADGRCMVDDG